MDLISREAVKEQAKASYHVAESMEQLGNLYEDCINAIPSAFEGMTNGEILKALFPNMKVHEYTEKVVLQGIGQDFQVWGDAWYAWWNSPYKGVNE